MCLRVLQLTPDQVVSCPVALVDYVDFVNYFFRAFVRPCCGLARVLCAGPRVCAWLQRVNGVCVRECACYFAACVCA